MRLAYRKPSRPTVYPSEIDLWIVVLLMLAPLMTAGLSLYALLEGNTRDAMILFATAGVIVMVSAIFTVPCRYTLDDEFLFIRCGLFRFKLSVKDIDRIEKSGSWLSGPALSLKRVLIVCNGRRYLVSPINRDDFINDLQYAVTESRAALEPNAADATET